MQFTKYNLRPRNKLANIKNINTNVNITRKRKRDTENDKPNKKQKLYEIFGLNKWKELNTFDNNEFNEDEWISATSISNYLMKDPLIDWLEKYYDSCNYNDNEKKTKNDKIKIINDISKNNDNSNILFEMGNKF